ncbi:MAG: cytochrome C oxidase subunit IV family protein [Anaerolineae bacterium]|nr:cytochrome C oxidase subunit IV family protein [Anaerolineae bacterium]
MNDATLITPVPEAAAEVLPAVPAEAAAPAHAEPHGEYLFGRPMPIAAYTVIYVILAVTSLIEVFFAETIPFDSWVRIPVLAGLSTVKAVLVMAYYMHLKDDSKIFAVAIILPICVGIIATLFLISVPATGY